MFIQNKYSFLKESRIFIQKSRFFKIQNIHSKKYSFSLKEAVSPTPIRGPSYFFTKVTAKLTDLFLLLKSPLVINSIKYRFVLGKPSKNWYFLGLSPKFVTPPPIGTFRTPYVTFWFRTLDPPP